MGVIHAGLTMLTLPPYSRGTYDRAQGKLEDYSRLTPRL